MQFAELGSRGRLSARRADRGEGHERTTRPLLSGSSSWRGHHWMSVALRYRRRSENPRFYEALKRLRVKPQGSNLAHRGIGVDAAPRPVRPPTRWSGRPVPAGTSYALVQGVGGMVEPLKLSRHERQKPFYDTNDKNHFTTRTAPKKCRSCRKRKQGLPGHPSNRHMLPHH